MWAAIHAKDVLHIQIFSAGVDTPEVLRLFGLEDLRKGLM